MTGPVPLLDRLRSLAEADPHLPAVVRPRGRPLSRRELVERVDAAARGLRLAGFREGDRVLFAVSPGVDALVLVLAAHHLGGVLVPQDPGVADALFQARMELLAPRWVFAQGILLAPPGGVVARVLRRLGLHFAPLAELPGARFVRVGPAPPGAPAAIPLRRLLRDGARLPASAGAPERPHPVDQAGPDAEAFIVCTSGTTAAPRAVVHTRRSLAAVLASVEGALEAGPGDVVLARDLHLVLPALVTGAAALIPGGSGFDPRRTRRMMETRGVTHAFLVTGDCRRLLDHCRARGRILTQTLRTLLVGAAPVPAPFLARLREILPPGASAWCVYGATELLPIARVALEEKVGWHGEGDLVGPPLPGVEARVREDGQLCVRGHALCRGYLGEPEIEEHASGDLARIDPAGIVLLGRAREMIIRGDVNLYPALYEPLVEAIAGVRRAVLLGDFDPDLADERVVLVVEPEEGRDPDVLRRHVEAEVREGPRRLDGAAQPDRIVVRNLPESGRSRKVDRRGLQAELGLRPPPGAR